MAQAPPMIDTMRGRLGGFFMRFVSSLFFSLGFSLGGVACGKDAKPFGNIEGTVLAASIGVRSTAVATMSVAALPSLQAAGILSLAGVVLSDAPDICAEAKAAAFSPNHQYFVMTFAGKPQQAVGPGTYTALDVGLATDAQVADALQAGASTALLWRGDASCANTLDASAQRAQSGSAILKTIDLYPGSQAQGSFTLKIGTQEDSLSGSFVADYCQPLETFLTANAASLLQGEALRVPCGQ